MLVWAKVVWCNGEGGKSLTSMGMASKPFQAMLGVVEVVFCGDGMRSCLLGSFVTNGV